VIAALPGLIDDGLEYQFVFESDEIAALPPPTHGEISEAAYYRFLDRRGAPDSIDDWFEAEQDLLWRQLEIDPVERPR
jgi:hypothetical protein